jgi:hypothetical protein
MRLQRAVGQQQGARGVVAAVEAFFVELRDPGSAMWQREPPQQLQVGFTCRSRRRTPCELLEANWARFQVNATVSLTQSRITGSLQELLVAVLKYTKARKLPVRHLAKLWQLLLVVAIPFVR